MYLIVENRPVQEGIYIITVPVVIHRFGCIQDKDLAHHHCKNLNQDCVDANGETNYDYFIDHLNISPFTIMTIEVNSTTY